jgi:Rrf2 family protein
MKLTTGTCYAVAALCELCKSPDEFVPGKRIASNERLPEAFVASILMALRRKQLISSTHGVTGGYKLAKDPREITLLEIVEAVEGPVSLLGANVRKSVSDLDRAGAARYFEAVDNIERDARKRLASITLAELCAPVKTLKLRPNNR